MGVIYENSPLVELIAELQWELTPVTVAPGAAVDPFLDVITADVTRELATAGYGLAEVVVPPQLPRELMPWKARTRFSNSPTGWPKFQVGPGIFTVNIAGARYKGWELFRQYLQTGFSALFRAYPDPTRLLKLKAVKLGYANGFSREQGFIPNGDFASRYLSVAPVLPNKLLTRFGVDGASITTASVSRFPVSSMPGSTATIQISEGKVAGKDSCVVHIGVDGRASITPAEEPVLAWFDGAHIFCDEMFDELLSAELKALMRPTEG